MKQFCLLTTVFKNLTAVSPRPAAASRRVLHFAQIRARVRKLVPPPSAPPHRVVRMCCSSASGTDTPSCHAACCERLDGSRSLPSRPPDCYSAVLGSLLLTPRCLSSVFKRFSRTCSLSAERRLLCAQRRQRRSLARCGRRNRRAVDLPKHDSTLITAEKALISDLL